MLASRLGASRDARIVNLGWHPKHPKVLRLVRPNDRVVLLTSCRFCSDRIAATFASISARFAAFAASSMIFKRVG